MNLREFYKKLRSPMGTTLLSLGGLILLVLFSLPLLLRNDAGKLEINRRGDGEATYDIQSNIKAVATPPARHSADVPPKNHGMREEVFRVLRQRSPSLRLLMETRAHHKNRNSSPNGMRHTDV